MTEFIYKLFRKAEWEQAKTSTAFAGSADDLRDGFLHFSTAGQVRRTCDRYFFGENDLVLAAVDASPLAPKSVSSSSAESRPPGTHGTGPVPGIPGAR